MAVPTCTDAICLPDVLGNAATVEATPQGPPPSTRQHGYGSGRVARRVNGARPTRHLHGNRLGRIAVKPIFCRRRQQQTPRKAEKVHCCPFAVAMAAGGRDRKTKILVSHGLPAWPPSCGAVGMHAVVTARRGDSGLADKPPRTAFGD